MIIRIVQMHFREDAVTDFLKIFEERKSRIRASKGCSHLELWQDARSPHIFFTYSIWEDEALLDQYRFSPLFKDTWARTKELFAEKAKAWSVNSLTRC